MGGGVRIRETYTCLQPQQHLLPVLHEEVLHKSHFKKRLLCKMPRMYKSMETESRLVVPGAGVGVREQLWKGWLQGALWEMLPN